MERATEFWFDDGRLGLALDGSVVEIFGISEGNRRYHVRQFAWGAKGPDKRGQRLVQFGFARAPGKIAGGGMGNVGESQWPELERLLRHIDAVRESAS